MGEDVKHPLVGISRMGGRFRLRRVLSARLLRGEECGLSVRGVEGHPPLSPAPAPPAGVGPRLLRLTPPKNRDGRTAAPDRGEMGLGGIGS